MTDACRALIEEAIRRNPDIGKQGFSAYEREGREAFISLVCNLASIEEIGEVVGPQPWQDLTPDQQEYVGHIVDLADRYGTILEDWEKRRDGIRQRVSEWVRQHCPPYLWLRDSSAFPLRSFNGFVERLTEAVYSNLGEYLKKFSEDLLVWMIKPLRSTAVTEWMDSVRTLGFTVPQKEMVAQAEAAIASLSQYGIGGIRAGDVVNSALFVLMNEPLDGSLAERALARLKNELKLRVLREWNPPEPAGLQGDNSARLARTLLLLTVFHEWTRDVSAPSQARGARR